MASQTLKDRNHRVIGYLETRSDGMLVLKNANHQILGYYDPQRNETKNVNYSRVGQGNLLTSLL